MRLQERLCQDQSGSVMVLVAFALTALMGLAALGTDVGRLYVEQQHLSSVADAAALSGAQFLPSSPDEALATAEAYLQRNGIDPATASVAVADDRRHLTVKLSKTVPLTFARVIGRSQAAVSNSATAWSANISGYFGAVPLGVPQADWQIGQEVKLKTSPSDGTVSPGNFQALALGGTGAASYEQNIMTGYQDWVRIGDWIGTEPGNMAGPTERAITYRIAEDTQATYDTFDRHSPRLVVLPILDNFAVNGRGQVQVVGFGMFFLEQTQNSGPDKGEVVGRFVRFITEGEGSNTGPDFGFHTTKLVQ